MSTNTRAPKTGMSRRTLAQGAAWSVPAISVAVAAPAFAGTTGTMSSNGLCRIEKSGETANNQTRIYQMSVGPKAGTAETWVSGETWTYTFTVKVPSPGIVIPNINNVFTMSYGSWSAVNASPQVGDTRTFTVSWTSSLGSGTGDACVGIGWSTANLHPDADIRIVANSPAGESRTILDPGNQGNGTYTCDTTITSGSGCCNVGGFGFEAFPCQPYLP
jgi:hypothetical protein